MSYEKTISRIENMSLDNDEKYEINQDIDSTHSTHSIKLISKDGTSFIVKKSDVVISDMVKAALEGDKDATEIHIPGVKAKDLKNIVEYMSKKKGDKTIVVSKPLKSTMTLSCSDLGKWEAEFIDNVYTVKEDLHDLVMSANYMAIIPLLELSCARVGLSLKGKNKNQMIEELQIKKSTSSLSSSSSTSSLSSLSSK